MHLHPVHPLPGPFQPDLPSTLPPGPSQSGLPVHLPPGPSQSDLPIQHCGAPSSHLQICWGHFPVSAALRTKPRGLSMASGNLCEERVLQACAVPSLPTGTPSPRTPPAVAEPGLFSSLAAQLPKAQPCTPPPTCAPGSSCPGLPASDPTPAHTQTVTNLGVLARAGRSADTARVCEGDGPAVPSCFPESQCTCTPHSPITQKGTYCVHGTLHEALEVLRRYLLSVIKQKPPLGLPGAPRGGSLLSKPDILAPVVLHGGGGAGGNWVGRSLWAALLDAWRTLSRPRVLPPPP